MGKNNKIRRKQKKKKKFLFQRQKEKVNLNNKSIQTSRQFYATENPFKSFSDNQRKETFDTIGSHAKEEFSNSIEEVKKILYQNDPIQLLSMLSFYELTTIVSESGLHQTDTVVGEINQFHPELCQAIILQDKKYIPKDIAQVDAYPKLKEQLLRLSHSMLFKDYTSVKFDLNEDEFAVESLRKQVMGHTQMVRNWGFINQVKEITKDIFKDLDDSYRTALGFSATEAITFFETLLEITETKLTVQSETFRLIISQKSKKTLVETYHQKILDQNDGEVEKFIETKIYKNSTLKQLQKMFLTHQDLFIRDIYSFDMKGISEFMNLDICCIEKIIKNFSYDFGDLKSSKIDHIIYDNPIWEKPILYSGGDIFYCFIPQVFFSFALKSLTNLADSFAKKSLEKRKSQFLEERIAKIVRAKFPTNNTLTSVKWTHDNREYETDIITRIDSALLIIEVKSGQITPPALRGAPGRLKNHLKEIIISPNQQSKRLKQKIIDINNGSKDTDGLAEKLNLNLKSISKIIRLSVSLEDFAMIQSNIKQHEKTGWLPSDFSPCPTMNIADFEILFDLLDHPLQIIHYLSRREEIEEEIRYFGDELDLMGYYIRTLFDSSDFPTKDNAFFSLNGESNIIYQYYDSKAHGITLNKPRPKLTTFWESIIRKIEERDFPNWTQIGLTLLKVSPEDQRKVIKMINEIKKNVRKNWKDPSHTNMLLWSPPKNENLSMVFLFFCKENSNKRDKLIECAADKGFVDSHINRCIVFAINIDAKDRPYDWLGMFLKAIE